jgi:hypothetical protein
MKKITKIIIASLLSLLVAVPVFAASPVSLQRNGTYTYTGNLGDTFGIGTTSPYAKLSVVGQVAAEYFTATSTTATSTFNGPVKVSKLLSTTTARTSYIDVLSNMKLYESANPGAVGTSSALLFKSDHISGAPWVINGYTTNFGGPDPAENDTSFFIGFNGINGGNKIVNTTGIAGGRAQYLMFEHDYYQVQGDAASRLDEFHYENEEDDGTSVRNMMQTWFPSNGQSAWWFKGQLSVFGNNHGQAPTGDSTAIFPGYILLAKNGALYALAQDGTTQKQIVQFNTDDDLVFGADFAMRGFNLKMDGNLDNGASRPAPVAALSPGEIWGHSRQTPTNNDGFLRLSAGGGTTPSLKSFIDISGWSNIPDMDNTITFLPASTTVLQLKATAAVFSKNVGVGTSTPYAPLSVAGKGVIDDYLRTSYIVATSTTATSTFANGIQLTGGCFQLPNGDCAGTGGGGGGSGTVSSGLAGQFGYYLSDGTTLSATSTVFVTPTGNVGVGSSTPGSKLDVWGSLKVGTTTATPTFIVDTTNNRVGVNVAAPAYGLDFNSSLSTANSAANHFTANITAGASGYTGTKYLTNVTTSAGGSTVTGMNSTVAQNSSSNLPTTLNGLQAVVNNFSTTGTIPDVTLLNMNGYTGNGSFITNVYGNKFSGIFTPSTGAVGSIYGYYYDRNTATIVTDDFGFYSNALPSGGTLASSKDITIKAGTNKAVGIGAVTTPMTAMLTVKGTTTANTGINFQTRDSSNNILVTGLDSGSLGISTTTCPAQFCIQATTTKQSTDIFRIASTSGAVLGGVDGEGRLKSSIVRSLGYSSAMTRTDSSLEFQDANGNILFDFRNDGQARFQGSSGSSFSYPAYFYSGLALYGGGFSNGDTSTSPIIIPSKNQMRLWLRDTTQKGWVIEGTSGQTQDFFQTYTSSGIVNTSIAANGSTTVAALRVADVNNLGAEKTTNGTFTGNSTGWTEGTGWAYGTNGANRENKGSDGTGTLSQSVGVVAGETYQVSFLIQEWTAGSVTMTLGGVSVPVSAATNVLPVVFSHVITAVTSGDLIFTPTNTSRFTIDTISVKKINGGTLAAFGTTTLATASGNVGVATTSPYATLSVAMASSTPSFVVGAAGSSTPALSVASANGNGVVNVNVGFGGGFVPIGSVVPWLKTLSGVPQTLPPNFVEASGQTISDATSPLNGTTLPDLNGNNNFLRGNSTSGGTGGAATHTHTSLSNVSTNSATADTNLDGSTDTFATGAVNGSFSTDASSSLPPYYNVVYIIRIK